MLKLIIADDEDDIRFGMTKYIDWTSNGVEIVASCSNGIETYEAICNLNPDIVLIDINMPDMTGLEVIERVQREKRCPCSFIILSAYDEFSYAQKAVKLNVHEYILKPCKREDLLIAVRNVMESEQTLGSLAGTLTQANFFQYYYEQMKGFSTNNTPTLCYPMQEEAAIINALKLGLESEIESEVDGFFQIAIDKNPHPEQVMNCCIMLYTEIYRLVIERGYECPFSFLLDTSWDADDAIGSLKKAMINTVYQISSMIGNAKSSNIIVSRAISYINQNYRQNINLNLISQAVFVTPAYISGLFKQHLGVNFVEYVNSVRIEHAKTLLSTTQMRNQEIADSVGYTGDKYFAQIFKRIVGLTPSQFREQSAPENLPK